MINYSIKKQQGAALAVGLILLLIITLMGYASMKGTILQEKMAAGLHNRTLAQTGANSAVRAGEQYLYGLVQKTNGVNVTGTPDAKLYNIYSYLQNLDDPTKGLNTKVEEFKTRNWTSTSGTDHKHNFMTASYNGSLKANPEYIIEEIPTNASVIANSQEFGGGISSDSNEQKAFLVTGKSQSGDGKTITLLQSMYTVVVNSSATN